MAGLGSMCIKLMCKGQVVYLEDGIRELRLVSKVFIRMVIVEVEIFLRYYSSAHLTPAVQQPGNVQNVRLSFRADVRVLSLLCLRDLTFQPFNARLLLPHHVVIFCERRVSPLGPPLPVL
jgi:hypothetical protein